MPDNALLHCLDCNQNYLCKRTEPREPYACVKCGGTRTAPPVREVRKVVRKRRAELANSVKWKQSDKEMTNGNRNPSNQKIQ
jgi:hypothetical protein